MKVPHETSKDHLKTKMYDTTHYSDASVTVQATYEPIDLCKHYNFVVGNALKYILRYRYKGDPQGDLRKAKDYLILAKAEYITEGQSCIDTLDPCRDISKLVKLFTESNALLKTLMPCNGQEIWKNNINNTIEAIDKLLEDEHQQTS